jgi:hypothetical protein
VALWPLKDRLGSWYTGFNQDLQNQLNKRQQLFGVSMQKAIVSDPTKSFVGPAGRSFKIQLK